MTLKQISKTLLNSARRDEEKTFRRSLPNGMTEEVTQLKSGDVKLTLIRLDVDPSLSEWNTVLKYWPERVPDGIVPSHKTEGRVHKLYASWPRPAEVTETA